MRAPAVAKDSFRHFFPGVATMFSSTPRRRPAHGGHGAAAERDG